VRHALFVIDRPCVIIKEFNGGGCAAPCYGGV
jgi:hypothetical protein